MALATRPKPKVQHKKRRAQHHKRDHLYMKPYLPYLPMIGVIALGALLSKYWPAGLMEANPGAATRIEAMTSDQNTWALTFIIATAGIAAAIFVFQNWFRFHHLLNRGERFIVKHPWFDVLLVAICTLGFILTRSTN